MKLDLKITHQLDKNIQLRLLKRLYSCCERGVQYQILKKFNIKGRSKIHKNGVYWNSLPWAIQDNDMDKVLDQITIEAFVKEILVYYPLSYLNNKNDNLNITMTMNISNLDSPMSVVEELENI